MTSHDPIGETLVGRTSSAMQFIGIAALATSGVALFGGSVLAQNLVGGSERTAAVCMIRAGTPDSVPIVVPAKDVQAMEAKGFGPLPCGEAFSSRDAQIAWRDRICRVTAELPEAMQGQLERRLGERPAVLCGMAEQALGQWDQAGARGR